VDRARDSYLNRLNHGYHSGRTPFGYVRKEGNTLVPDNEQAQIVKEIFKLAYQGTSARVIGEKFSMSKDRIKSILGNPIYAGYVSPRKDRYGHRVQDPSKWIKGAHKPIVSLEYYLAVQKVWRNGPKKTKYTGLFQKLIYCPYDKHHFTLLVKTKANQKKYFYYWCQPIHSHEKTCNRRFTETFVENLVLRSVSRSNLFTVYKKKSMKKQMGVKEEVAKIDKKIEKYLDLLDYQNMPVSRVKKKIEALQERKRTILQSVKPVQDREILKYLKTIREVYSYMNRAEKHRLWHLIIKRIILYKYSFKIEWKNDIQTQGSLKTISMYGGDEGI
jgi:hypothetical protein